MTTLDQFKKLKDTAPHLEKVLHQYWDTPLDVYSSKLYQVEPSQEIEFTLIQAFESEFYKLGKKVEDIEILVDQLKRFPILQTGHHVTPTNGPTFLTLDLISLLGLPRNHTYLVGAYSGVPFSNAAWSGALSYGNIPLEKLIQKESSLFNKILKASQERKRHGNLQNRISLISSGFRDDLVFSQPILDPLLLLKKAFTSNLNVVLEDPANYSDYVSWGVNTCSRIQKQVFQHHRIIYFDLNRVIASYLVHVLRSEKSHPVHEILFGTKMHQKIMDAFGCPAIFYASTRGKESNKSVSVFLKNFILEIKNEREQTSPIHLAELLENGKICPGLFLIFFILRFLNGFRCFGSFQQIEYLETYRKIWKGLNTSWSLDLRKTFAQSLTTGRYLDTTGAGIWPLDMAIQGQSIQLKEFAPLPMKKFWKPVLDRLTINS